MNRKMVHGALMTDSIKRNGEEPVPLPLDPPSAAHGILAFSPFSAVRVGTF